ncbi:CopG family transcriptional regulator [Variovorax sp. PCZ-1]|uniref:CopG family transcriptional regulator n=1 Tax=Variovorax sp. PCZ-1 TaxID=2835533 RepID=UPI001BCF9E3C|nr:CopG family transcriptional regulator [Variovorax sp. PCZ-1]MBS7806218.1 CopG family transcriptional regulator [Variovorax sp. PCZ-1]
MKNVTITMEDHVADWARVEAAKQNVSLSRMLGEILAEKMRHDDAYERAYQEWKSDQRSYTSDGTGYPKRDEIYAERLARIR